MQNSWTREQTIIALYLYCQIPFNKVSNNNLEIISKAKIIGRSTTSLKMKIGNFGSFDDNLKKKGTVGLTHTSKLDQAIWEEYNGRWDNLAIDATNILAEYSNKPIIDDISAFPDGKDREQVVKRRIGQSFFRNMVLSAYNNRCCITGLSIINLLEASHIIGWAEDERNRTNPQNGLALNVLFHKAYDANYLGITPKYKIKVSSKLFDDNIADENTRNFISHYNNKSIILPNRFLPNTEFLEQRYQSFLP